MFIRLLISVAIASLTTASLAAHDFWLAASTWDPVPGVPVMITGGLGEHYPTRTDFRPRPGWFDHWRVIGESGDVPVTDEFQPSDLTMATKVTFPSPGAYLGVMRVTPLLTVMKGPEFTDYLREEGLDAIIASRHATDDTDQPAREVYARYAKIAIRNGNGSGAHLTRPLGMSAEFVPTTDPTSVRAGESLTVRLLAEGQPVAGAVVTALSEGISVKDQTDADGLATLRIEREGAWLIKTVHMVRWPATASLEADWASYWVTLAFHTAGP